MTNKHTTEVECKGLISKKTNDDLDLMLTNHPDIELKVRFGEKIDLFWDVGSETVEAFVRCRFDEGRKNPGWLIKVQEGGFNKRTEIDLPIGRASDMTRHHDYEITGWGSIWKHAPTKCTLSLYYVVELKQYFLEIESDERTMDAVYHCEKALAIKNFPVEDTQNSLFSMIKAKTLLKRKKA